ADLSRGPNLNAGVAGADDRKPLNTYVTLAEQDEPGGLVQAATTIDMRRIGQQAHGARRVAGECAAGVRHEGHRRIRRAAAPRFDVAIGVVAGPDDGAVPWVQHVLAGGMYRSQGVLGGQTVAGVVPGGADKERGRARRWSAGDHHAEEH